MLLMIKYVIRYRRGELSNPKTDLEFIKQIRDNSSNSIDFERTLADRIIKMIETR